MGKNLMNTMIQKYTLKKAVDYTHQTVGHLTVLAHNGLIDSENTWVCQCVCGQTCIKRSGNLKRGLKNRYPLSCGCRKAENEKRRRDVDTQIGRRYYQLTITGVGQRITRYKKTGAVNCTQQKVLTLCSCGTMSEQSFVALQDGRIKSCGCYGEAIRKAGLRKKDPGESGAWAAYQNLIKRAKYKILPSQISFEEFKTLAAMACHYCGVEPSNRILRKKHAEFRYSGLDRVDSSLGYLKDNIVPACKDCNLAKGTKTREQFMQWVQRIYGHSF